MDGEGRVESECVEWEAGPGGWVESVTCGRRSGGGVAAMMTEGGVEIQHVRERERTASPSVFYKPCGVGGYPKAMRRHPNRAF